VLSPFLTHRLPDLYPDANRFRPERWFTIKPSTFEYIPFGAGPRLCLGATFAALELRLVLALIVQRFRLALRAGEDISHMMHAVIMSPKRLSMTVHAQDKAFDDPPPVTGTVGELVDLPNHTR